jgi:DNA-binding MarR family transcriptional regulator
MSDLSDSDYERLLGFRDGLRRFLRFSEDQAAAVGLTPAQHQLLLAIRGHQSDDEPTIGDVAEHLLLRHHSVVGLVDRAEAAGLVSRTQDDDDRRVVRLRVTQLGARRLEELSALHLEELRRLTPRLRPMWADLESPVP